jgi:hypothetical protein
MVKTGSLPVFRVQGHSPRLSITKTSRYSVYYIKTLKQSTLNHTNWRKKTKTEKATVDTKKISILWSCQNIEWTLPLRSSRRDGQKTYMERLIQSPDEGVMPSERCSVVRTSGPSWNFRPAPELGLLAQAGTSGPHPNQDFRPKLELPARIRARTSSSSLNFRPHSSRNFRQT